MLSIDDVKHGIRKGIRTGVSEYCFVCAAGLAANQDEEIHAAIVLGNNELDIECFDILAITPALAAALNPRRRGQFGTIVTTILRDEMHRTEVANKAAKLWNDLEK